MGKYNNLRCLMVEEETDQRAVGGSSLDPAVPLGSGRRFVSGLRQAPAAARAAGPPAHSTAR